MRTQELTRATAGLVIAASPGREQDAELAATYVLAKVREQAGSRWKQGVWPVPLADTPLTSSLGTVATARLRGVSEPVARGLVAWGRGERRVHLLSRVPEPGEVLAWQATGERCVSLLPDGAVTSPHADGLAFVMHDLCHLEKFVELEHHAGQVGFFRVVHEATRSASWQAFLDRFDAELLQELQHVVADMNGSAVFLFAALKMKLKMAVRRRVARLRERPLRCSGALDDEEQAAFDVELATLVDLLGLSHAPAAHNGALTVSARRDDPEAALALLRHFEMVGRGALADR